MADDYGPGFQKAREAALARSNGVCQACGHFRATAAHHWQKRYSPDTEITPDHLTGLCDLCHGMITALRKTLTAAESEKRSEAGEDADRLTERQKSYIRDLFRQGGHHFPDEGFVRIAEALFTRYISGEGERLEQHHSILLGAWRAEASAAFPISPSTKPTCSSRRSEEGIGRALLPKRLPLPNRVRLESRTPAGLSQGGAPRFPGRGGGGR